MQHRKEYYFHKSKLITLKYSFASNFNILLLFFQSKGGRKANPDMLNLLIIGIDSVSRLNMIRHMPKTYKYLTETLEAIDFKGYNKVADNTYPNMLAVLLGMSVDDYRNHSCSHDNDNQFPESKYDNCPFIWKEYAKVGYVTSFVEDWSRAAIFNYLRVGFVKEPTDFYGRPYQMAAEDYIRKERRACQGTRSSFDVMFDHVRELERISLEVPYFSLCWTSTLTHDVLHKASAIDRPAWTLLKDLSENGTLNRSIVLFMSDHGLRFGRIRNTLIGRLEERLPYSMMVFPKWFRYKYKKTWSILKINTNRLVSNYDLHLTLRDIALQSFVRSSNPQSLYGHGQSLFLEVSENRTCADAGVPEHFCTCYKLQDISPSNKTALKAAQFTVRAINMLLRKKVNCSYLNLKEVRNNDSLLFS